MNALYLDHAATTPLLLSAQEAMLEGFARWANPSSPHKAGRAVRSALEEARGRIQKVLGWEGEVILTSGASEALELAFQYSHKPLSAVSPVEHEAVLRHAKEASKLAVLCDGRVDVAKLHDQDGLDGLVCVQHANNETGVIQPVEQIGAAVREAGGVFLVDCAQTVGKLPLPEADMIALSAHKFGGPIGIGALLVRNYGLLRPVGGQERGYRPGTENVPAVLGMAAALEEGAQWYGEGAVLRQGLENALKALGAEVVAEDAPRLASIGAYRMPNLPAAVQLIRFDGMGIAVSAGSACSSGSLRISHVLEAMGLDSQEANEIIRVSLGRETSQADLDGFVAAWKEILPQ